MKVWSLSVAGITDGPGNSPVAVGDTIYYVDADTPKLSKKTAGYPFGVALEIVTTGATKTIKVLKLTPGVATVSNSSISAAMIIDGVLTQAKLLSGLFAVASCTKSILGSAMTDGAGTSGYIDFTASSIPAGSIVLGWKAVTSVGFTGDTTATIQVGVSGTVDKYSIATTGSVFGTGCVGSTPKAANQFEAAAATPRVTITSTADFTSVAGTGACVVTVYYVPVGIV
jgi:hypothetical protein